MQIESSQLLFLINHVHEYGLITRGSHKMSKPGHRNDLGTHIISFSFLYFIFRLYCTRTSFVCLVLLLRVVDVRSNVTDVLVQTSKSDESGTNSQSPKAYQTLMISLITE